MPLMGSPTHRIDKIEERISEFEDTSLKILILNHKSKIHCDSGFWGP